MKHETEEEEEAAKKKRRHKIAHGGKTAKLGRKRKHRDDGGGVENATGPQSQLNQSGQTGGNSPPMSAPTPTPKDPSWKRIPDGPEPPTLSPPPGLTDAEFAARWGRSRKRGGSACR